MPYKSLTQTESLERRPVSQPEMVLLLLSSGGTMRGQRKYGPALNPNAGEAYLETLSGGEVKWGEFYIGRVGGRPSHT